MTPIVHDSSSSWSVGRVKTYVVSHTGGSPSAVPICPERQADKGVAKQLKMLPLDQGRSSWRLARQKSARARHTLLPNPDQNHWLWFLADSTRTLVLNPHVDGVARLWASKLVLHRQASQSIADLLLAPRRLRRCRQKCWFTLQPQRIFDIKNARKEPRTQAAFLAAPAQTLASRRKAH